MKKIQFLQETEQGSGVYGANHLADVSETEFKRDYLGINMMKVSLNGDIVSKFPMMFLKIIALTPLSPKELLENNNVRINDFPR